MPISTGGTFTKTGEIFTDNLFEKESCAWQKRLMKENAAKKSGFHWEEVSKKMVL